MKGACKLCWFALCDFYVHHTGKCIRRFGGIYAYCGTLKTGSGRYWPKYYVEKHAIWLKDYRIRSFLSIRHADGNLCKHLGIDSNTDLNDRYSNLFLNAYINRHAHTEYLKMILFYSPLGI